MTHRKNEEVAKATLAQIGIDGLSWSAVSATSRFKNSGVKILFSSGAALEIAKFMVRAAPPVCWATV
eukprot:12399297-Karenia_brevis.AAC.1